jgi:hypothetical protein
MATKPSDFGQDLGRLEGSVDVLRNLTFAVISFLIAIVGGGIFLLVQIYDVKSTVAETKRDIGSAIERITKIEGTLGEVKTGQGSVTGSLARIESALKGQPQLLISVNDAQTIRSALKFDPETAYKGVANLGDVLTDAKLSDFPKDLIEKFPQLKTLRYVFDMKNQILIATAADQRVVAVV